MKICFFLPILILSLSLVSAVPPPFYISSDTGYIISVPNFESVKLSEDFHVHIHVFNQSNGVPVNYTSCYLHLYDQNGNELTEIQLSLDSASNEYETTLDQGNFSLKGIYEYRAFCANNNNNHGGLTEGYYYVTTYGFIPGGDVFKAFVFILFIVAVVYAIFSSFMAILRLVMKSETIYTVLSSWGAFILIIVTDYLSKAYLLTYFIESITGSLIIALGVLLVVIPVISLIVTMIIKGFEKKNLLSPQEFTGKGRFLGYG